MESLTLSPIAFYLQIKVKGKVIKKNRQNGIVCPFSCRRYPLKHIISTKYGPCYWFQYSWWQFWTSFEWQWFASESGTPTRPKVIESQNLLWCIDIKTPLQSEVHRKYLRTLKYSYCPWKYPISLLKLIAFTLI